MTKGEKLMTEGKKPMTKGKKLMKWIKRVIIGLSLILMGLSIGLLTGTFSRSQIMEVAGLAVAESVTKWNNLKDVLYGDAQTSGIAAVGPYVYDAGNTRWDRLRGDTTNGMWVNVKAGTITAGSFTGTKTPADTYTNPTDAINSYSLNGVFNGTTWDRLRGDTTSGMWVNVKSAVSPTGTAGVTTATSSTITTGQVTVDTTVGGIVIKASNASRRSIIIRNQGTVDMYIGPSGVTSTSGLLIKAGESITLDRNTAAIYGIVASTSTTAGYLEE